MEVMQIGKPENVLFPITSTQTHLARNMLVSDILAGSSY